MIVKILSSASNFAGIHYNVRKNDAGKSELLRAENFGSLALIGIMAEAQQGSKEDKDNKRKTIKL